MERIDKQYINGTFVKSIGTEMVEIVNPATGNVIGESVLGNEEDVLKAIAAAKEAFPSFAVSTVEERQKYLQQLHDAVIERIDELKEAAILEYGATVQKAEWSNRYAAETFLQFKELLSDYCFECSITYTWN